MTPLRRCAVSPQGGNASGRAKPVPRRLLEQILRATVHRD
jgi:hypothetical protein